MKKILILGAAVLALAATPAVAAQRTTTATKTTATRTTTTTATTRQAPAAEPVAYNTPSRSPLSGLYVGIYGGYDWSTADSLGFSPDVDGWDGGVFVGYKLDRLLDRVNHLGIGLNAAVEVSYGSSNADDTNGGVKFEKEDDWSASFRPGFEIVDQYASKLGAAVSPYAILGYRNTEFKATGLGGSNSNHYDGFELGLGTELVAYENFGVRVEYAHTWYSSEDGIDPDSDDLRAGIAYHF